MPHRLAAMLGDSPKQQMKLLLWPFALALLFGAIEFGEFFEKSLTIARNATHQHAASGDIVVVEVDDKSLRQIDNWPWPRSTQAKMVDEINRLGARRLVIDVLYTGPSEPAEDQALADALAKVPDVTVAAQTRVGVRSGKTELMFPIEQVARHAKSAVIDFNYDWQSSVWNLPRAVKVVDTTIPSLATVIADTPAPAAGTFPVDYSLDVQSVPRVSAARLLNRQVKRAELAGKTVVLATNSMRVGDQWLVPGQGKHGGAYIHVAGAETLKRGTPVDLGWLPGLVLAFLASALAVTRGRFLPLGVAAVALLLVPIGLELLLVFSQITPALFALAVIAGRMTWRRSKDRGLINSLTGLPNLAALRAARENREKALVGVRVNNYAEIASTLNAEGERLLVEQIVQRLSIGHRERIVYQGDEGIFAWFADKETPFASQLEALHALFRSPIRVDKTSYDIALSFGVEMGSNRSISSRLGSAMVAAQEADAESLKWKFHDPARLQEVSWRLSLLSQLDEAIEKGEVWLAFQPKLDLATRQTIGAEALARWTHPDKGPISPTEFISAAEQSDRIEHLTDFVLDKAIAAAARIVRGGHDFSIAVNLSARMLNDRDLPARVAAVLRRHGLAAERLTLELTETAAVSESGLGLELLARLRQLGVKIAIDDYGTGLSTLDYLKKVPATELKIDQSFIRSMRDNRSDLIMVQSTITLAKSLGRTVVAEGVEDALSLEQLRSMGCDQVQGFIVGRPMALDELVRRLDNEKRRSSAA